MKIVLISISVLFAVWSLYLGSRAEKASDRSEAVGKFSMAFAIGMIAYFLLIVTIISFFVKL